MIPMKKFIRQLRDAADTLESLFISDTTNQTKKVAMKIIAKKHVAKHVHWTQRPENKNKLEAFRRKMRRNTYAKKNAVTAKNTRNNS